MSALKPVLPKILSCQLIDQLDRSLAKALGCEPRHVSAALITCDQDDSLYAALDYATKFAEVDVVYAKSFYAGSAHASGPLSGEVLGVLAATSPDDLKEGVWALREGLAKSIHFVTLEGFEKGPAFFPHLIAHTGRYLSAAAGIRVGEPMAYLIAPPLESVFAVDAALKAADVTLAKWFGPPTETNFGGAYLTGELADLEAASEAFVEAIEQVVRSPHAGLVRPDRERV